MTSVEVLAAADRNMAEAWRAMIAMAPKPDATLDGEVLLLSSGLPVPIFNPTIVTGPVTDPQPTVRRVIDHYSALGVPFLIWFRDEVTDGLADACATAGLVEHWRPPLMVLDPVPESPPVPEGLHIEAATAATIADHTLVLAEGFGMPHELVDAIVAPGLLDVPGSTFLIGRVDGEPVATVAAVLTGDLVGIYNVATTPPARPWLRRRPHVGGRRRRPRHGAVRAVLQSSEQGAPVYERMGFTTPTRYRQFQPG